MNPDQVHRILSAWAGLPVLPGARCRGRHHLFDPADDDEPADTVTARHAHALMLCQRCPARQPCQDWVDSLPFRKKPLGVIAGTIRKPRKKDTP